MNSPIHTGILAPGFTMQDMTFDPASIMREIDQENLWTRSPRVTYEGSAQRETEDIILRGPVGRHIDDLAILHQQIECEDYPAMEVMLETRELVSEIFVHAKGEKLGRVILAKLPPNAVVHPHADEGLVPETYLRYHAIINSGFGSWFLAGRHAMNLITGQVCLVNVRLQHAVVNLSDEDRIHLIVDVL